MNVNADHAPRLVLASRSPRRANLLRDAGFSFEQADPPFDDPPQPNDDPRFRGRSPESIAIDLAQRKAHSVADDVEGAAVILAADTICVGADGALIGQPADRAGAARMLDAFLNTDHAVVTAVALRHTDGRAAAFADRAVVSFGHVTPDQIKAYLDSDEWCGKAGGYNLTDRVDAGWPVAVTGDPATVVGLPMRRLVGELAKLGVRPEHT
jgi:septum formation protein